MFFSRKRQEKKPRRQNRQPLTLEALEERTLLNAAPTTVLDLNGLAVDKSKFSATDILVRFQETPGKPGGPALVQGTSLGSQLPLATGYYEINLGKGMTVDKAVSAYQSEKGVLSAEPDYELKVSTVTNDPLLNQQWALRNTGQNGGTAGADIHAEQAWSVANSSPNVVVAVLDTGIDYDHPDLYDNIWINQADIPNSWYTKSNQWSGYDKLVYKWQIKTATPGVITFRDLNNPANKGLVWNSDGNSYIDASDILRPTSQGGWATPGKSNDLIGWNFVGGDNNPWDDNGHGTNVAGILGAMGNSGTGVSGVDWNVQIMPVKFIGSDGYGSVSNFIQALNYAVQHGAKITNNSWEGAPYSQALYDAFRNAQQNGVIAVAAAGNDGSNNDYSANYPASLSQSLNNVVAVAATDNTDHLASFSNYGAHSVALAAPGVNILSTLPNGRYGWMTGTSMATPEVAGAMALVWGLHPDWSYTQVINQVVNSTDKLPSLQGRVSSGGRLDVAAAVEWNRPTQPAPAITVAAPKGQTNSQIYSNNSAQTIKPWGMTMSSLTLPDLDIGNLAVNLNVNFPVDSQLYIYLISPTGKTIALDYNRGGRGSNLNNTVFSQQAGTPIADGRAPFNGAYLPEASLNQLIGSSTYGNWRLAIYNYGGNSGTLLNWGVTVTPPVASSGSAVNPTTSPAPKAPAPKSPAPKAPAPKAPAPNSNQAKWYSNNIAGSIKPKSLTMSSVSVPGGIAVGNVQVLLNVKFPSDRDLYIYLISPTGKTIALDYNRGGWSANLSDTTFSDSANTPIANAKSPSYGTYRPEASLDQLKGTNAGGNWRLAIRNYGNDSGTLVDWSLILTPA